MSDKKQKTILLTFIESDNGELEIIMSSKGLEHDSVKEALLVALAAEVFSPNFTDKASEE